MPLCVQSSCSIDKGSKTTYWEKRNLFKIGTGKTEHPHERKWGETSISSTYLQKKKVNIDERPNCKLKSVEPRSKYWLKTTHKILWAHI